MSSYPSGPGYNSGGYSSGPQQQGYGYQQQHQGYQQQPAYYTPQAPGRELKRPGTATAAAILGIIYGVFGFFISASLFFALTTGAEYGLFNYARGKEGVATVLLFVIAGVWMLASVMVFIGSIHLLSGKTNMWVMIAGGLFLLQLVLNLITTLIIGETGEAVGYTVMRLLVPVILCGVMMFLAAGSDVRRWLQHARSQAY